MKSEDFCVEHLREAVEALPATFRGVPKLKALANPRFVEPLQHCYPGLPIEEREDVAMFVIVPDEDEDEQA